MTSWNRGNENEEQGERNMQSPDLGDKIVGAGQKAAGEIEQGIDNLGDTISGKQNDLQGRDRNMGAEIKDNVDDIGRDIDRGARDAADNMGDAARDAGRGLDKATDRAGDWVQERGDDVRDATNG